MKANITVVRQPWTGWVKEQPEPLESTHELQAGEMITFEDEITSPLLGIIKIHENEVTLFSTGLVQRNPDNKTINLLKRSTNQENILKKGETLTLVTQTMDAGTTYRITLNEVTE